MVQIGVPMFCHNLLIASFDLMVEAAGHIWNLSHSYVLSVFMFVTYATHF